jgi:methylmalonyl-CoA mutase C-terminal domain/subunit
MARRTRALLAKLGLDVHNRGIITICKKLMEENVEVIYIGNSLPNEIIQTAIQESVDIIGVSSLAGAHLTLGGALIDLAKKEKITEDVALVIGGIFPPMDIIRLKNIGYDCVFTPRNNISEIIETLKKIVCEKGVQTCQLNMRRNTKDI